MYWPCQQSLLSKNNPVLEMRRSDLQTVLSEAPSQRCPGPGSEPGRPLVEGLAALPAVVATVRFLELVQYFEAFVNYEHSELYYLFFFLMCKRCFYV